MEDKKPKILVVRKMSALEYYYNGNHKNPLVHEGHKNNTKSIRQIERILKKEDVDYTIVTRRDLTEELISDYDAVVSSGGDGTVIATAFHNIDTPQLNLVSDIHSVGALCQKDISKSLASLLSGYYRTEEWTRQDVLLDGKLVGRALNEVCVGEALKFSKLAKYHLSFSNEQHREEEEQSGSGLVIVTGTGSTAWPAAFKPFPRESQYFHFKTLLLHSGEISSGVGDYFKIEYHGHEGKFAIDTQEFDFPRDSVLEIKLSQHPLKVVKKISLLSD